MRFKKKKYDLIFSLGEACSCTQTLRKYNLQIQSFPFDWLYGSNFKGRCQILAQYFNRFIEKADLTNTKRVNHDKNNPCRVYYNSYNDITFNHDFFITEEFEDIYPIVKEKYDRRIKRLLEETEKAQKILVVFLETPINNHPKIEDQTILEGYDIIQKAFSNTEIDLIYIKNADKQKQESLNEHVCKFLLPYKCPQKDAVDLTKLKCIFAMYELPLPCTFYLMKKLRKILIELIPLKQKRVLLKRKYHI